MNQDASTNPQTCEPTCSAAIKVENQTALDAELHQSGEPSGAKEEEMTTEHSREFSVTLYTFYYAVNMTLGAVALLLNSVRTVYIVLIQRLFVYPHSGCTCKLTSEGTVCHCYLEVYSAVLASNLVSGLQ